MPRTVDLLIATGTTSGTTTLGFGWLLPPPLRERSSVSELIDGNLLGVSKEESSSIPVMLVTISKYQSKGDCLVILMKGDRLIQIYLDEYLDELEAIDTSSIGVGLIQLIVSKESQAPALVQQLMQRANNEIDNVTVRQGIVELLESVLVSKFSQLSRQEIEAMFLLSDIKQTRVYQEARQEGRQEGEASLLLRLLSKRFGKLSDRYEMQINALAIAKLEKLGEALFDFENITDLDRWLEQ